MLSNLTQYCGPATFFCTMILVVLLWMVWAQCTQPRGKEFSRSLWVIAAIGIGVLSVNLYFDPAYNKPQKIGVYFSHGKHNGCYVG